MKTILKKKKEKEKGLTLLDIKAYNKHRNLIVQELTYESIEQMEKSERYCSIIYGNLET